MAKVTGLAQPIDELAGGGREAVPVAPVRAWSALTLLGALYVVSFVDRLILALLIEPIKSDLGISDVQVGLLIGTSFAVVFSIAGLPLARLADTGNRMLLIFVGATAWGLSTAAAAFANSFAMLLVLRIGVAIGEAALTPPAMSLLSDMFPPAKRALPISIYVMVGVCGGAGAMFIGAAAMQLVAETQTILPVLGDFSVWRLTLLFVGIPAVLLALLVPIVIPSVKRAPRAPGSENSFADLLNHYRANRLTYFGFYVVTGLVSAVNFSILTWFPTHLIRSYGLSATSAGYMFGVAGVLASLAGGLLLPFIARRLAARGRFDGPLTIALAVSCISTPLLLLSLLAPTPSISMLAAVIPLALQMGLGILMAATAPLLAPASVRAQLVAAYYLVLTLVGLGAGPPLVAWISEHLALADGSIARALAGVVLLFAPLQILVIVRSRRAFARTYADASGSQPA